MTFKNFINSCIKKYKIKMPSQYDNTYQYEYSKTTYDSQVKEVKIKIIRKVDSVLEIRPPRYLIQ